MGQVITHRIILVFVQENFNYKQIFSAHFLRIVFFFTPTYVFCIALAQKC